MRSITTALLGLIAFLSAQYLLHADQITTRGELESVDTEMRVVTVLVTAKPEDEHLELEVSRKARIYLGTDEVVLAALEVGQPVEVTYDDQLDVATLIRATPLEPMPEKQSTEFEALLPENGLDGWWFKEEVKTPNWENKAGVLLYKAGGPSLVSDRRFGDFEMELEYNLPKDCNCGVFLRGRYEVKLTDTPKGGTTSLKPEGRNGAIFSRIPASKNAYKGTNRWNKLSARLEGMTVTVTINDEVVIDAQEIVGGPTSPTHAVDHDEASPGPIMFFAHPRGVGAKFRNIKVRSLDVSQDGSK
ncbi:MAG: DUF1080 domain-containing protein [Planctomycetia bacterium]